MKSEFTFILVLSLFVFVSCSKDSGNEIIDPEPNPETEELYFPPLTGSTWVTMTTAELGWNTNAEQDLYDLLDENGTKAFVLLKDGKIVLEWYFDNHNQETAWYWASAGKTLTAFTTGIAFDEAYLNLTDMTSDYLGTGWTSLPQEKEDLITVRNQLTMTTGMDDTLGDCKTPDCLTFVADAGTRWAYHNAPYTLIQDVVTSATEIDFEIYFKSKLKDKIGMTGQWISTNGENNVYWSTARSMARFGLLNLNNGIWDDEVILGNTNYLSDMKNTSQDLNKSYGYLWWLNGKEGAMVPNSQMIFNIKLMSEAPDDLFAGLGKNDQKLHVVPSQNLVLVRMGEDTGEALLGPSGFDNLIWEKLNAIVQ